MAKIKTLLNRHKSKKITTQERDYLKSVGSIYFDLLQTKGMKRFAVIKLGAKKLNIDEFELLPILEQVDELDKDNRLRLLAICTD